MLKWLSIWLISIACLAGCSQQYVTSANDEFFLPGAGSGADCQENPDDCSPTSNLPQTAGNLCNPKLEACGPFPKNMVELCIQIGGGESCNSGRWKKSFYDDLLRRLAQGGSSGTSRTGANINRQLNEFYVNKLNYSSVYNTVKSFYNPAGGPTSNGCVAFVSTALRKIGVNIPFRDSSGKVSHISLVTLPLSNYLQHTLRWKKITNLDEVVPGEIMFTKEDGHPGYPAHVFMFSSWKDKSARLAYIVDNQDGGYHVRSMTGGKWTPFEYALRPQ